MFYGFPKKNENFLILFEKFLEFFNKNILKNLIFWTPIKGSGLNLRNEEQIFFRDNEHCFSQKKGNKFVMNLFFPFTDCGTNVVHDTEEYVYTNQVIFFIFEDLIV